MYIDDYASAGNLLGLSPEIQLSRRSVRAQYSSRAVGYSQLRFDVSEATTFNLVVAPNGEEVFITLCLVDPEGKPLKNILAPVLKDDIEDLISGLQKLVAELKG